MSKLVSTFSIHHAQYTKTLQFYVLTKNTIGHLRSRSSNYDGHIVSFLFTIMQLVLQWKYVNFLYYKPLHGLRNWNRHREVIGLMDCCRNQNICPYISGDHIGFCYQTQFVYIWWVSTWLIICKAYIHISSNFRNVIPNISSWILWAQNYQLAII